MSETAPLVIGVDLDGVCADYEGALRASIARHSGRELSDIPAQTVMDAYSEWGLTFAEFEEAHRRAVVEDRMFRTVSPTPNVSEVLWELSDAGMWIRIITHRLLFNGIHEVSAADTAWWLDHHHIPYRDLCFIGDKPGVGADLYIDDSPRVITALRTAGRSVIIFDQPYNRHLDAPRVTEWRHVPAAIQREVPS
ncbi:MAG: hypothetical protein WD358_01005 [Nitriliruptoraceae bacterium]